ncbi:cyclic nucleotide-binding domain protein (macronuclear) [Tetrahymena thermophila SB210]|uniref:Cyclic nucleotide-binding domain protein n=1 Tax=Tetrahymena thermophila (strain SB210) TaxID=312017 RepID=Q233N7_TETTS|nr:cyclic nucleotide-binding domain protein [Tetrahymena thermophila SB210]EAR91792.2 cyclic nucleotide-binding domain protein [Tetrahymena thermophila SB210]|eukprot:XP_001012037.2 cyclic nucleotide-binding domain protein [Tetrahymena thermophila SB210]
MKDKFLLDKKAQNIIELVNLFKNILLISHIFACLWILAAKYSEYIYDHQQQDQSNTTNNPNTWIELMQLTKSSWVVQYIYSYYFITVTMITVGFGDVRPTNVIEVLVCIFLMMTCCVIFGFTINSIGQIFQDFYQIEKLIRQKRIIIGNYMIRKGVSKTTMKKIYEYLDYYWKEKNDESQQEEQEIIQQLSVGLREELLAESYRVIFKESSIFKENFSYDTLLKCLPFIQEQRCTPEEVIYDAELGDQDIWLYFVLQGELQVYIQSPNKSTKQNAFSNSSIIYTLRKGDQFGDFSFFSGEQTKMSLKSQNFSKLMKIKRSDFLRVVEEDQTEYENFCMIKDQIILSKDRAKLKSKCISCSDTNHDVGECPYLHNYPNKGRIISSTFYSLPHLKREKPKYERNLKLKKKSLNLIGSCCSCLLEYFNIRSDDLLQYEEKYLYLNSFQKYGSQQQNETIQSQQYIDSNIKENINNLNAACHPNINLNSSSNILSSNTQSVQNIPQLNYQLSSFLKQKSNLNKQKSFKQSLSYKKSNSSIDESEEQKDNINENNLESPKLNKGQQKKQGFNYSQRLFDCKQQKISYDNLSQTASSNTRTTIINSNKFKTQSIFNNHSHVEKKLFQHHHSLMETKHLDLSQNLDDFFTQENNNYSFSKMNPNTPSYSDQIIRNIQTIQSTQHRKSYNFQ